MNREHVPVLRRNSIWQLSLVLCVAVLCGCNGDAAQFRFDDYRARLARSLKLDVVDSVESVTPVRRPRRRDMLLEVNSSKITVLDFLRLYDCALGEVIGQRNSILGKVAPASQRLFNDLAFLELAPVCIEQLQSKENDALADKLIEAVDIKLEGLAKSIANATIASNEFSGLWRVPARLEDFPKNGGSLTIVELHYVESQVESWLSGDFSHDSVRFENALGKLRYGEAGSLITAAVLTKSQLEAADQMAVLRREGRPLCFNGKPSRQGRILRRVIDKFFIGEIQVWLSRVNALNYDLMAPYQALEQHLDKAQTPAYRKWRKQRDLQLTWLTSSTRQHVARILPILQSCDLAPGSSAPERERES